MYDGGTEDEEEVEMTENPDPREASERPFLEIFEEFHGRARRSCRAALRRLYGSWRIALWSASELDDQIDMVINDTLVWVHAHWHQYDPSRGSRMTWTVAIARRKFVHDMQSEYKNLLRRSSVPVETVSLMGPDPIVQVLDQHTVEHGLKQLAPSQHEAMRLRYQADRSLREVATTMNVSVPAVQSLLQRGKDRLKQCLAE